MLHARFKEKTKELLQNVQGDLASRRYEVRLVKLNSPVMRLKLIEQFSQLAAEQKIVARELYLSPRIAIMPQLEREIQRAKGKVDVICVNGFDAVGQEAPTADHIVVLFDQFAKDVVRLPLPVIFWLPNFIVDLVYAKVTTFWKLVASNVFEFHLERHLFEIEPDRVASGAPETPDARKKRIERLEEQVEEIRELAGRTSPEHSPLLLVLAHSYFDDKQYEKAYEVYAEVLAHLENSTNVGSRATVLHSIGNIYRIWGVYDKALNHYRESLAARRKLGDDEGVAQTTHQLGMLYQDLGEFDKAIDFFNQSIERFKALDNASGIADNLLRLGMIHEEVGLHAKAVERYREAFELYRKKNQSRNMAIALFYTGRVYYERDLPKEAVKFFVTSKAIFESIRSPYQEIVAQYLDNVRQALGEAEYERLCEEARRPATKKQAH
ncbi:MAG: tetratricopeptide repeat protein [Chloroherpetonaceae bacterium]|nr:tetratricopeptide repeat protein [Chloroherpetonaceae bacterium]MDW8437066.1 tetratricopeptide repeat protein [Chloroherpetonaceae bacterium]